MAEHAESVLYKQPNQKQRVFLDYTIDILLYTVILGTFAEYTPWFYIDSFSLILLTAVVLKIVLASIISLEHAVTRYFNKKEGTIFKILNIIIVFSILFFSKFLIIELIDILFGSHVEIQGFVPLVLLIITMIVSRKLLVVVYKRLE